MNRRSLSSLAALLLSAVLLGCSGGTVEPDPVPDPDPVVGNTRGFLTDLPPGLDARELEVVSGADSSAVDQDGVFHVDVRDSTVSTAVFAVDEDDRPVFMSLHTRRSGADLEIGVEETAYSLVLMHPLLMTTDPDVVERARWVIGDLASFRTFVGILSNRIEAGYLLGDADAEVEAALAAVYDEFIGVLAEGYRNALRDKDIGPINGLTLLGPDIGNTELSYSLRNGDRLKRWISVYASTTDLAGDSTDYEFIEIIPSPGISLLQILLDLLDGGGLSWPAEEGGTHTVPLGDLQAVDLRCYGLGTDISLGMEDFDRAFTPMLFSIVFDIGIPIISAATGFDAELRGRPQDHPLMFFIENAPTHCPQLASVVYQGIVNQRMPDVIFPLADCFIEQILDNPRVFTDLVNQMLLSQFGAQVARRVVNNCLWPLRLVNAAITGFNVGWTLASVATTETVTEFHMDIGGGPELITTIHGNVVDAATGNPIEGVAVSLNHFGGPAIAATSTDAAGAFQIGAPAGQLSITCSMFGYHSSTQFVEVSETAPQSIFLPTRLLAEPSDDPGSFSGRIIDASSGGAVPYATVEIARGLDVPDAEILLSTTCDGAGIYAFENVESGSYTVTASKDGFIEQSIYVTVVSNLSLGGQDITISPLLGGDVRFVLTWGATPTDLDSHLATPTIGGTPYEVRWNARGSLTSPPYAMLDVDDVTSYGPETITVSESFPGAYRYAVYRWSSGNLTDSQAQVVLYWGDTVMREWTVPTVGSGRWWYICDFDIDGGELVEHNVLQDTAPPGMSSSKGSVTKSP